jgi:hypothetical protein
LEKIKLFPNDWIKEKTQRTPNRCLQFQTRSISPLNKIYTLSFSKNIFCLLVSRATWISEPGFFSFSVKQELCSGSLARFHLPGELLFPPPSTCVCLSTVRHKCTFTAKGGTEERKKKRKKKNHETLYPLVYTFLALVFLRHLSTSYTKNPPPGLFFKKKLFDGFTVWNFPPLSIWFRLAGIVVVVVTPTEATIVLLMLFLCVCVCFFYAYKYFYLLLELLLFYYCFIVIRRDHERTTTCRYCVNSSGHGETKNKMKRNHKRKRSPYL